MQNHFTLSVFNHVTKIPLYLILILLFAGCSSTPVVNTDYNPALNYNKLKTYNWHERKMPLQINPKINNTLFEDRVRNAIASELQQKNFTISKKPDFQVTFNVTVQRKMEARTTTSGMSYHRPVWPGAVVTETQIREYNEGALIIDILSADGKNLIWRGTTQKRITGQTTPEERIKTINLAVAKILSNFPPPSKDKLQQKLQEQGF